MFLLDSPEPGLARITIDASERRNAIPIAEWHRLRSTLQALPGPTRVVLIGGAADFSAGADLREFSALARDPAAVAGFRTSMAGAIEALAAVPIPVLAVVPGACFGAGVALALAADMRVAGEGARFAITPARLGIGYPASDVARLTGLIGRGQAARMLFTADTLDAHQAEAIGLVEVVAADAWMKAFEIARKIAANARESTAMLKAVLNDTAGAHDAAFDTLFAGDALAEGLAAYRERRPARFT